MANPEERIAELEALVKRYQAAVRKVDDCCGCLNYAPYDDLGRGEVEIGVNPGNKCKDCGKIIDCFGCACAA